MKDKVCETKKGLGPLVYETYGHGSLISDNPCHLSNPVQLGTKATEFYSLDSQNKNYISYRYTMAKIK